ncbi:MAG TPA: Hpt domain-containing protein [Gammaproteobacteria bacterium]|nr:Hpt domain-containing protein [Gammaproteobacteria bacterium]
MSDEQPPLLDREIIDMLRDAIGESLDSIIDLYIQDVPNDIAAMQQALAKNDLQTVHRLAHSLKSSSANLGAMQASALAADLEHRIADGEANTGSIAASIAKFATCFDQTRSMLKNL